MLYFLLEMKIVVQQLQNYCNKEFIEAEKYVKVTEGIHMKSNIQ